MNTLTIGIASALIAALAAQTGSSHPGIAPEGTLKALILTHEAGERGYDSYNRGSMRCAASNRQHVNISGMTIAQIQAKQRLPACTKDKLLAVGGLQIVPETLQQAVTALDLPRHTAFTPVVQDRIFSEFLAKKKRPEIARYIQTGQGLTAAANAVANEWAIFKRVNGRGAYDNVGNNHGRVSASRVIAALKKAHITYTKLKTTGKPEREAYASALGINSKV